MKKNNKLILPIIFILVGIIIFFVLYTTSLTTNTQTKQISSSYASSVNFDQYCQDGVYYVQKDGKRISCGRAPNCGGKSYENVVGIEYRSKAECWVEDYFGGSRCAAYCSGNIPLCCYKLEQTKNPEDCTWPERGYCLPSQCQGVGEGCGNAIITWCTSIDHCVSDANNIPYIPLDNRLSGQSGTRISPTNPPQPTSTPQPPTNPPIATNPPQPPTSTTQPNQPTTPVGTSPTNKPRPTNQSQPTITPSYPPHNETPYQPPQPTNTPFLFPTIKFKTPKELAREVINPENIQKLNDTTKAPLEAPEKAVHFIKNIDTAIEQAAESWIFKIRIFIQSFVR
ncbi:MAG: hypothetical protein US54_C0001G0016 [Candidatus Roizmanbacteria bacterium GW2011_GWA2_37_7]|uniref:Uncharacterized protein n=1 Tax=Candidatus Roizmanbacteria bacterium GW2011_GWA2_37_7 TaxID=1618481 RepID=A0A0G0KE68_9BACT|nr:MAG: hypothetical protein US54_C0001G0016 [Candidatus Roizmanbacteria bacterium GW2011_GWA2_37_7]